MVRPLKMPAVLPPPAEQAGQLADGLSIFDPNFERSLINIVPDVVKAAMIRTQGQAAEIFYYTEHKLKKYCDPDETIQRLKLSFWDEYNRAQDHCVEMKTINIIRGSCSMEYFYKVVMPDNKAVAWIISPPKDLFLMQREMLEVGLDEQREILMMPVRYKKEIVRFKNGVPQKYSEDFVDHKLIDQKIKIIESLKLRVWGAVTQKIQHANLNMNLNSSQTAGLIPENASMDDLLKLESSLKRIQGSVSEEETTVDVISEESPESEPTGEEPSDQCEEKGTD